MQIIETKSEGLHPMTNEQGTARGFRLLWLVLIAAMGGFLFGYDTAVISGCEQQIQQLFVSAQGFRRLDLRLLRHQRDDAGGGQLHPRFGGIVVGNGGDRQIADGIDLPQQLRRRIGRETAPQHFRVEFERRAVLDGDCLSVLAVGPDGGGTLAFYAAPQVTGGVDNVAPGCRMDARGRVTAYSVFDYVAGNVAVVPASAAVLYTHDPDPVNPRSLSELVASITTAEDLHELNEYTKASAKAAASKKGHVVNFRCACAYSIRPSVLAIYWTGLNVQKSRLQNLAFGGGGKGFGLFEVSRLRWGRRRSRRADLHGSRGLFDLRKHLPRERGLLR